MKKLVCILAASIFMCGLMACSEEEAQNAATATYGQDGMITKMIFDAKGDAVTKITQETTMDLAGFTEEQIAEINSAVEMAEESFGEIDGVEYSAEEKDGKLVETIVMSADKDTLSVMIDQGILPVDNEELTQLSLDATVENLENSGWTVE